MSELDDAEELLAGLKRGSASALVALFDRYGGDINRLVRRFLGIDQEHDDVVQQVFLSMLTAAPKIREARALRSFLVTLTINTVRSELRRRTARRWLRLTEHGELDVAAASIDPETRPLLRKVYAVLDKLPDEERIAFVLRHVEERELDEAATAMGVSLATYKRRLKDAIERFRRLAARDPELAEWLQTESLP